MLSVWQMQGQDGYGTIFSCKRKALAYLEQLQMTNGGHIHEYVNSVHLETDDENIIAAILKRRVL